MAVTLPASVDDLGFGVFVDCASLESAAIASAATLGGLSVGSEFRGCTSLATVSLPGVRSPPSGSR
jgi:hypothetical protein